MNRIAKSIAAVGLAAAVTVPAHAETTIKAISFIPKNHPVMAMAREWVKEVNAALKGKLKINYVGGPEVISRYQQWDAVSNGVIGMIFAVTNDIQDKLPEGGTFVLSRCTASQERKTGFYDMISDAFAKTLNIKYIGRVQYGSFYLWLNKDAKTLADLKGLKMRTGSLYDKMMRELGMVPVNINAPETYTALERGVVDGFGWPNIGPRQRGWLKKVHYVIDLPFFSASNVLAMMNLDKWKALPADVKKKVMDITVAFEPKMVAYYKKQEADEWKKIGSMVKKIKFSPAENKRYLDLAYGEEWKAMEKRLPADKFAKLKKATCN
jgi:TRAP-type C4-dicarboxylate transport system substrate-binding protein